MAFEDVVVGMLAGVLGGIVVAVFTHFLTGARWEKEFGTRVEELKLKKQELEAQYGAGVRAQALSEVYESLGMPTRADRWPVVKATLEAKLDSARGHWIPRQVRDGLREIIERTEAKAREMDPDRTEIESYEKWEEAQMADDLSSAPPEVQAQAQIGQLRLKAMREIKGLISESLLEHVEKAHQT